MVFPAPTTLLAIAPAASAAPPVGPFALRPWLFAKLGLPAGPWVDLLVAVALVGTFFIGIVSASALIGIWGERKVSARIQSRRGPNRVGRFGLLQSFADGIKLLTKEDLTPGGADKLLFRLAPYLAFAPVFAAFLALPFGPELTFEPRLAAGAFWVLAILSVEAMGVILAGWASDNKWAVYGAMREACQMVSYEIPLGLSIVTAVLCAGTLNLVELGHLQSGGLHTWVVFRNPFVAGAFVVFFVASLASNKRAPFDLPESESELVAGYHTEYSGLRFSFLFFAEYAAMFAIAGVQAGLFLGGWNDPAGLLGALHHRYLTDPAGVNGWGLLAVNLAGLGVFVFKCALLVVVQMWVRWTLPRPRIDQVLYACVKVLLPLACLLLLGAALWELFAPSRPGVPWRDYHPYRAGGWDGAGAALLTQAVLAAGGMAFAVAVVGWVAYAVATGGRVRPRLSEAAPIRVAARMTGIVADILPPAAGGTAGGPPAAEAALFWLFAALTAAAAVGVVFSRDIVRTAVALLFALAGVAGLFVLLSAEFLAAVQLVVYVGGTLILIVFGVMLTARSPFARSAPTGRETAVGLVLAGLLVAALLVARPALQASAPAATRPATDRQVADLGVALLGDYLLPFELSGVLLLAVMVGAAYLAKPRRSGEARMATAEGDAAKPGAGR